MNVKKKVVFYLYAYAKTSTQQNMVAKNYFHTMPKNKAIRSILYQSL
jgi:hypothetical protein